MGHTYLRPGFEVNMRFKSDLNNLFLLDSVSLVLYFTLVNLVNAGVKELLQSISEKQGARMDSPESAADIPKFIESFKV